MSESKILKDAKTITQSLRRSRRAMEYSLLQAEEASTIIYKDDSIINDTLNTHKHGLKGALKSTKRRLTRVEQLQILEKWSQFISILFFAFVCMFIILKRTRILLIAKLVIINGFKIKHAVNHFFPEVVVQNNFSADSQSNMSVNNLISSDFNEFNSNITTNKIDYITPHDIINLAPTDFKFQGDIIELHDTIEMSADTVSESSSYDIKWAHDFIKFDDVIESSEEETILAVATTVSEIYKPKNVEILNDEL